MLHSSTYPPPPPKNCSSPSSHSCWEVGTGAGASQNSTDSDKGKTVNTHVGRQTRSTPDGGQKCSRLSIEDLPGQSITDATSGTHHLEVSRLAPPSGATTIDDLVGVLFQ